jgi:hypothetical protein
MKPEKVLYKLVREKGQIRANVMDVCISEGAVYFALWQPKTRHIFVVKKKNKRVFYLSTGMVSKMSKFECNGRDKVTNLLAQVDAKSVAHL